MATNGIEEYGNKKTHSSRVFGRTIKWVEVKYADNTRFRKDNA